MDRCDQCGFVYDDVPVQAISDVLARYECKPEYKAAMPDGGPCDPLYRGVLSRRVARVRTVTYIGKESNRMEDQEAGAFGEIDDIFTRYPYEIRDYICRALDGLSPNQVTMRMLRRGRLTCIDGKPVTISKQTVKKYLTGESAHLSSEQLETLRYVAAETIAPMLAVEGSAIGYGRSQISPETMLAMYRDAMARETSREILETLAENVS